ncbi:MAG: endonuclease/exonuclease/phosphatase family protein [Candidatus Sigynarchaeota archaeon]
MVIASTRSALTREEGQGLKNDADDVLIAYCPPSCKLLMLELFGSVNPRPTDDLFCVLYPAGLLSLAINAALTGLCLLAYASSSWMLRSHFAVDTRSRRDLAVEFSVIVALGCSYTLFPVFFALHLLIRCFSYASIAAKASRTRDGVSGNVTHVNIKIAFLRAFLVVLIAGLIALPIGFSILFPGSIAIYYEILYASGVVLAITLNAIKKPRGMPGFLAPWRPPRRVKLSFQVAAIAFPVLCGIVVMTSGVIKYHAPAPAAPTSTVPSSTRVVTYNIRNGMAWEVNPANNWVNRRDVFCAHVASLDADIIGVQEAYQFQLEDLKGRLNALSSSTGRVYKYTGFGRDDGVHGGEHEAIFFDASRFTFVDGDTFWLSPCPDFPSKQWDPSNYRVCTWARLERVATGAQIVIFNVHYATSSHYSTFHEPASALIKGRMPSYAGGLPVFLLGDFNMINTTRAFDILLHEGPIKLVDTYTGPPTYTTAPNFDATYHPTGNRKIDFVLVNNLVSVMSCTIPRASYGAGQTYSDHYPVVVDCIA